MSSCLVAVVAGVGRGTGSAIAHKFASQYLVVCLARNLESYEEVVSNINKSGGNAIGVTTDLSSAKSVKSSFDRLEMELGGDFGISAAVFNASTRPVCKPFLELTEDEYAGGYDILGRGAFLFAQATLPRLVKLVNVSSHPSSLIFTGATASIKSFAEFVSFSNGKWVLRSLAQSFAKEFGPQGVQVAHTIIDGVIGIPTTVQAMKEAGKDTQDTLISPEAIVDAYWYLHTQPKSAFSWEIDIRPFGEKW